MKQNRSLFLLLAVLAIALPACASGRGGQPERGSGPASDVAAILSGRYQLQADGSDLRLDISSTGGTGSRMDLLATVSGTYAGRGVSEQAAINLRTEGPEVLMSVVPHFGEPVTPLSPDVQQFSQREIEAACTLYLRPYEQGWAGATEGRGACVQAVTGATGQWQVVIEPGMIRFSDPSTRRSLVFREVGGSAAR